jgi:uncharacterized cupredoxin-like copper-binding protein
MPIDDFRAEVDSWLAPWPNTPKSIADDHAPLIAISLYELLLGTEPERCYLDTYAAYWAVATDFRALGQAPSLELQEREFDRILEAIGRADALAERDAIACLAANGDTDRARESGSSGTNQGDTESEPRVVEIEAAGSLQFRDSAGNPLEAIGVTPGETVLFRVDNTAHFDHSFYIGTESELEQPAGMTDTGIGTWVAGIEELEWRVPDDVTGIFFGCTIPGHVTTMHGRFVVAEPSSTESPA